MACRQTTPEDARAAREGMAERNAEAEGVESLVDATVPPAVAGDSGWAYSQRVTADLNGDGRDETAVLIADVVLDRRGNPIWEDGHRWQLYVQEHEGARRVTRLYARFVPRGKVTAELGVPAAGKDLFIVLIQQSPERVGVYEYDYRGPLNAGVRKRLERDLDESRQFSGSPRP